MPLLSLENITKSYDKKTLVLKKFNLSVDSGEIVAIIGKSGSGKSTVLNIIAGIDSADGGRYTFQGNDMLELSGDKMTVFRRENIGFVLQHFALIENNTVFKNIALPLYLKHEPKKVIKEKVVAIAEELEIEEKLGKIPKQLSGGEAQRVAIARAIINQPSLILADEPTGALDENTGLKIMQIFQKLNKKGHTFIIVTHDPSIAAMCDRTIKTIILLSCTVSILSFSLIGCSNSNNNKEELNTSKSTDSIVIDDSGNNTSNYSQEFEIDENDKNATSPQANDSIDLG